MKRDKEDNEKEEGIEDGKKGRMKMMREDTKKRDGRTSRLVDCIIGHVRS